VDAASRAGADVDALIDGIEREPGPPWQRDHEAAMAAMLALRPAR
jgi:hypothetical protein